MEAIGTLAGGIAHDFNNLLMTIQGNASLMQSDLDAEHPHYNTLEKIERAVKSGVKLTRQLLGYARKGQYEIKPLNLNRLVREAAETIGRTRKDITIRDDLSSDLHTIMADQSQMEQVLLNLFVNAADAMSGVCCRHDECDIAACTNLHRPGRGDETARVRRHGNLMLYLRGRCCAWADPSRRQQQCRRKARDQCGF